MSVSRTPIATVLIASFSLLFTVTSTAYSAQPPESPLDTLRAGHPRLILTDDVLERVRGYIDEDETARVYLERLTRQADTILGQDPVEYVIVGPRLLTQSRRCLDRVWTLGLVYRLTGEEQYAERLKRELASAASFPDWNPSHFLDTAEMTHAFALAYDWLYDYWSENERAWIREAMIEKGLSPAKEAYEDGRWWARVHHNWNQVCNGGIGIGALAVAEHEPELANLLLRNAIGNLPYALASYAPDGGWDEGPGYWHYATRYTVYFLDALQTALGTDFGLSEYEGLDRCGFFYFDACGPADQTFNYADAGSRISAVHEMFWLARRYDHPVLAWFQRKLLEERNAASALDLIWYTPEGGDPKEEGVPLDSLYTGVDVAFFRSAWDDPNRIFVGFKGGDNQANHSHLDLGCFVLDSHGVRWAIDLGTDDYNLPGYFGARRWEYFRLNTFSHNTLVIGGENQSPQSKAPIIRFGSSDDFAFAIADLSDAYPLETVRRGMALVDRKHVIVQDELSAGAYEVVWQMMTDAIIMMDGRQAYLAKDGNRMLARILSPGDAVFTWVDGNPPPPQRQFDGAKLLQIRLDQPPESPITVLLTPYGRAIAPPEYEHDVKPLDEW